MTRKASPRTPPHPPAPPPAAPEPDPARAWRARAEKILKDKPVPPPDNLAGMSAHEMQRIIHELRVHQIEMEAQNEELQRQHAELAAAEVLNADLKESLRIKRLAFDLAISANCIANTEGVLTHANDSFIRLWGYPSTAEVVGKPIPHFLQDPKDAAAIIAAIDEAGCWEGCYTAKRKDGSTFIAHGLLTLMRDELGQSFGYQSSVLDITERGRTEAALHASEARYREIFELAADGILQSSPDGIIIGANSQMLKLAGRSLDQQLGLHVSVLFSSEELAAVPLRFDLLNQERSLIIERNLLRPDGTRVPVEMRSKLMPDGTCLTIYSDITARKQAGQTLLHWSHTLEQRVAERTEELLQSEARFRQLAEVTVEGIAISEGGRLIDGNAQLGTIHGYELAEMIGRPVMDFIAPESRATVTESICTESETVYEALGLRKDGSVFPAEAHGRMGNWHGKTVRFTALRDLTEGKRLAARIQAQQEEIERVGRLALISEISAAIIHQICQPISSLSNNLAGAVATVRACELQRCNSIKTLDAIQEDVTRIREIVIHLRALAHPERPDRSRIDLNRVVVDVLPLLQREATIRRIRLKTALAPDLPPLLGDAIQLEQVVLNLVRNGFDACADCPPLRRWVTITTQVLPGQELELCVWDAGSGLAPAIENRLFEVFFTTKQEGHGLSLRLCRTIVNAHDGSIEAANNPGGCGAVFRVLLPAES